MLLFIMFSKGMSANLMSQNLLRLQAMGDNSTLSTPLRNMDNTRRLSRVTTLLLNMEDTIINSLHLKVTIRLLKANTLPRDITRHHSSRMDISHHLNTRRTDISHHPSSMALHLLINNSMAPLRLKVHIMRRCPRRPRLSAMAPPPGYNGTQGQMLRPCAVR